MSAKIQIKKRFSKVFGIFCSFVDHFRKDSMGNIVDNTLGNRSILVFSEICLRMRSTLICCANSICVLYSWSM